MTDHGPARKVTALWRGGRVVDHDGAGFDGIVERLLVGGRDLDDALRAWWPTATPWPRLIIEDLETDDHVEAATALLSVWPAGARGLELRADAGQRLPPMSAIPAGVVDLRILVDKGGRLDLSGLAPGSGPRTLMVSCVTGSVDLRPLRGDPSLVDVDLRCKVSGPGVLPSWSGLGRLRMAATGGLAPLVGDGGGPPALHTLELVSTAALDLAPLTGLSGLRRLTLSGLKNDGGDLVVLGGLPLLSLSLGAMPKVQDLTALTGLENLDDLRLSNLKSLRSLDGLLALLALHTLTLAHALPALGNVEEAERHGRLYTVALDGVTPARVARAMARVALGRGFELIDGDGEALG